MSNSAVQVTFPCPACGKFVTLRTFRATGPCPVCGTTLEVNLYVRPIPSPGHEGGGEDLGSGNSKKFDERRFRPVAQPPDQG